MPIQKVIRTFILIIMRNNSSMVYSLLKETSKLVFCGSTKTSYVFASQKKNPMLGPRIFLSKFSFNAKTYHVVEGNFSNISSQVLK